MNRDFVCSQATDCCIWILTLFALKELVGLSQSMKKNHVNFMSFLSSKFCVVSAYRKSQILNSHRADFKTRMVRKHGTFRSLIMTCSDFNATFYQSINAITYVWMCGEQKPQLNFTLSLDSDSVNVETEKEGNSGETQSWTDVVPETAASLNT